MLKMQTKRGMTTVISEGKEYNFSTIAEALNYVWIKKFLCLVEGKRIGVSIGKELYPVRSLIPATRTKKVKFYKLAEETV